MPLVHVKAYMLGWIDQSQILWAIVPFVPVKMVNKDAIWDWHAKFLGHDKPMDGNAFARDLAMQMLAPVAGLKPRLELNAAGNFAKEKPAVRQFLPIFRAAIHAGFLRAADFVAAMRAGIAAKAPLTSIARREFDRAYFAFGHDEAVSNFDAYGERRRR